MIREVRVIARGVFFFANLIAYWGVLPWLLVLAGRQLDRLLVLPSLPVGLDLGLGSLSLAIGVIASLWIAVVLYLRGGGFPIALLPPSRLVREGPYQLSRHPLYVVFTIYLLGWGAIDGSVGTIGIVLPGFVLFWSFYALAHEERVLAHRFGEDFSNYKRKTPFFVQFRRIQSGPGIVFSLTYLIGKGIQRLLFPIRIEGREHLPQTGPAVIVANHACYLDPIFVTGASNRFIRFLTTSEMMRTRVGKWLFFGIPFLAAYVFAVWKSPTQKERFILGAALLLVIWQMILVLPASPVMYFLHRYQIAFLPLLVLATPAILDRISVSRRGLAVFASVILIIWTMQQWPRVKASYRGEWFYYGRHQCVVEKLATLPGRPLIALLDAGRIPYWSDLPAIDVWGLCDSHIAREGFSADAVFAGPFGPPDVYIMSVDTEGKDAVPRLGYDKLISAEEFFQDNYRLWQVCPSD